MTTAQKQSIKNKAGYLWVWSVAVQRDCVLPRDYTHPIPSLAVVEASFNGPRKAEDLTIQMQFTARLYHKRFRSYNVLYKICESVVPMVAQMERPVSIDPLLWLASAPVPRDYTHPLPSPFKDPQKAENRAIHHKRLRCYLMFCDTCESVVVERLRLHKHMPQHSMCYIIIHRSIYWFFAGCKRVHMDERSSGKQQKSEWTCIDPNFYQVSFSCSVQNGPKHH